MDHREIGRRLDLFMFHELAPGSPIWLGNGTIIYNLLADRIRQYNLQNGYQEVRTPVLWRPALYDQSGHMEHYAKNMFFTMGQGDQDTYGEGGYAVKPMNCPGHMLIYKSKQFSYQDLPYRLHDQGILHRNEVSGAIGGLTRCRAFCQDDGHVFLAPDQIAKEVADMIQMIENIYIHQFKMFDLRMVLALRPEKFMGDPGEWDHAEAQLKLAIQKPGAKFTVESGGAFYGPKIDFFVKDSLGREWQTATIQLDFQLPQRFALEYMDKDGERKPPVVIHRAFYGSFERFIGILLEHYQEQLPLWLCPVQAVFLPISEKHHECCRAFHKHFQPKIGHLRTEVDYSNNTLNAKIIHASERMIPYMLVVGDKEMKDGNVTVRHFYDKSKDGPRGLYELVDQMAYEDSRSHFLEIR